MDPTSPAAEPARPVDPDEAMLRELVVADPAARRRVFTALLRALTNGGR